MCNEDRRLMRVSVPARYLYYPVVEGARYEDEIGIVTCVSGIPYDAVLIRMYISSEYVDPQLERVYEHPTFPQLPEGATVPHTYCSWSMKRFVRDDD